MGKEEHADGRPIEPVFFEGDDKGTKHPVAWKRTWVAGSGPSVGFDVAVEVCCVAVGTRIDVTWG